MMASNRAESLVWVRVLAIQKRALAQQRAGRPIDPDLAFVLALLTRLCSQHAAICDLPPTLGDEVLSMLDEAALPLLAADIALDLGANLGSVNTALWRLRHRGQVCRTVSGAYEITRATRCEETE